MGFGASLPADGQRRKAGAAPRPACAPPPNARVRVFRLAKQDRADFDLCHPATHASRTMLRPPATCAARAMLHKFFRFVRFQSTNQTITASHSALPIESPSSANRHIKHTNENPRKKQANLCTLIGSASSIKSHAQGASLCLAAKRKVGWLTSSHPT